MVFIVVMFVVSPYGIVFFGILDSSHVITSGKCNREAYYISE